MMKSSCQTLAPCGIRPLWPIIDEISGQPTALWGRSPTLRRSILHRDFSRKKIRKTADWSRKTHGKLMENWWLNRSQNNLVGGLEHFLCSHILGISSSQLTFIFFRGVAQPPSSNGFHQQEARDLTNTGIRPCGSHKTLAQWMTQWCAGQAPFHLALHHNLPYSNGNEWRCTVYIYICVYSI